MVYENSFLFYCFALVYVQVGILFGCIIYLKCSCCAFIIYTAGNSNSELELFRETDLSLRLQLIAKYQNEIPTSKKSFLNNTLYLRCEK